MRPRIALLNAANDPANNRRNFRRELDADLAEFEVPEGEVPDTFDYDACVVTGSQASVYWDEPWILSLKQWVGDAIEREMPILGVCFGHQVVADVLGGQVEGMDEYEIGYRTIERREESVLFDGLDREFTAFTTHSDRVSHLPPGATLTAVNDFGIHGFRKDDVFAVQFHPEYDTQTAEEITLDKDDQLSDEKVERVLEGITDQNYAAACETKTLFENFIEYVRDQSEAESVAGATADD